MKSGRIDVDNCWGCRHSSMQLLYWNSGLQYKSLSLCFFWQMKVQQPDRLDTEGQEEMSSKGRVCTLYASLLLLLFLLPLKTSLVSTLPISIFLQKCRKKKIFTSIYQVYNTLNSTCSMGSYLTLLPPKNLFGNHSLSSQETKKPL